jgi:hypothetical protein
LGFGAFVAKLSPAFSGALFMLNTVSFQISQIEGEATLAITPCVDGVPLTTLVSNFEIANGYNDPAGGYGGIVPSYYRYGPLLTYFCGKALNLGISESIGEIYVLGCQCGEVGCWPLKISVTSIPDGYRWSGFTQPHRPERSYDGFGPFLFDSVQYEAAVRSVVLKLKQAGES